VIRLHRSFTAITPWTLICPDGGFLLLDELMPEYDVVERHRIIVRASPELVFDAIREANLAGGSITRLLLTFRAIPAAVITLARSPRAGWNAFRQRTERDGYVRLQHFEYAGFTVVAERIPEELVIGLLGRFWTARASLCRQISAETFRAAPPAGQALAGWNFTVAERADGASELRTETRVWCAPDARWKFRLYWLVVRPGSGLIRRSMLQAIRRHAELR
jgi:hypothetical protein